MSETIRNTPMTGKEKAQWYRELRQSYSEDLKLLEDFPKLTQITKRSAMDATRKQIKAIDEKLLKNINQDIEFIASRGYNEELLKILEIVQDTTNKILEP